MPSSSTAFNTLQMVRGIELCRLDQVKILAHDLAAIGVKGVGHAVLFHFGVVVFYELFFQASN
jgi:hypothetical protein